MYNIINGSTKAIMHEGFNDIHLAHEWIKDFKRNNNKNKTPMVAVKVAGGEKPPAPTNSDVVIANFYILKSNRASESGIEFSLTFAEFKRLSKTRFCKFTGLPLCERTFTIDRINNKKGYVTGNVAACHKIFNQIKAIAENPANDITVKMIARGMAIADKHIGK